MADTIKIDAAQIQGLLSLMQKLVANSKTQAQQGSGNFQTLISGPTTRYQRGVALGQQIISQIPLVGPLLAPFSQDLMQVMVGAPRNSYGARAGGWMKQATNSYGMSGYGFTRLMAQQDNQWYFKRRDTTEQDKAYSRLAYQSDTNSDPVHYEQQARKLFAQIKGQMGLTQEHYLKFDDHIAKIYKKDANGTESQDTLATTNFNKRYAQSSGLQLAFLSGMFRMDQDDVKNLQSNAARAASIYAKKASTSGILDTDQLKQANLWRQASRYITMDVLNNGYEAYGGLTQGSVSGLFNSMLAYGMLDKDSFKSVNMTDKDKASFKTSADNIKTTVQRVIKEVEPLTDVFGQNFTQMFQAIQNFTGKALNTFQSNELNTISRNIVGVMRVTGATSSQLGSLKQGFARMIAQQSGEQFSFAQSMAGNAAVMAAMGALKPGGISPVMYTLEQASRANAQTTQQVLMSQDTADIRIALGFAKASGKDMQAVYKQLKTAAMNGQNIRHAAVRALGVNSWSQVYATQQMFNQDVQDKALQVGMASYGADVLTQGAARMWRFSPEARKVVLDNYKQIYKLTGDKRVEKLTNLSAQSGVSYQELSGALTAFDGQLFWQTQQTRQDNAVAKEQEQKLAKYFEGMNALQKGSYKNTGAYIEKLVGKNPYTGDGSEEMKNLRVADKARKLKAALSTAKGKTLVRQVLQANDKDREAAQTALSDYIQDMDLDTAKADKFDPEAQTALQQAILKDESIKSIDKQVQLLTANRALRYAVDAGKVKLDKTAMNYLKAKGDNLVYADQQRMLKLLGYNEKIGDKDAANKAKKDAAEQLVNAFKQVTSGNVRSGVATPVDGAVVQKISQALNVIIQLIKQFGGDKAIAVIQKFFKGK